MLAIHAIHAIHTGMLDVRHQLQGTLVTEAQRPLNTPHSPGQRKLATPVLLLSGMAIVLYSPKDGAVKRIPLDGAVVELVSKLPD